MYARFLISLAMLSIALTISAIHIYSSTQKYYKPFVKEQASLSSKTGFQFYAIPPILTVATIKALYSYENYTWNKIKTGFVKTGVNAGKIINWSAVVKTTGEGGGGCGGCCGGMPTAGPTITAYMGSGSDCFVGEGPIVLECMDKDSAGHCICDKETFDYIKTYLNFFTNITKKEFLKKFVEYLEEDGNQMLKTLNNYNQKNFGDKSLSYTVDNVEILPLVNITSPVIPNKTAILLVIYIVDVKKNGKTVYKLKVPFEIDIRVNVLGDLSDTSNQKFATQHVTSYAVENITPMVKGFCKSISKTGPVWSATCESKTKTATGIATYYTESCDSDGNCTPIQHHCSASCSVTLHYNDWTKSTGTIEYGKKYSKDVVFSKAGYTGLHYIYRIDNRIVYREDLTNIPFRSFNISRIYDMILTPFARTSGYVYDKAWVINDYWAMENHACFAKYEKQGSSGSYHISSLPAGVSSSDLKGLPNGGYCNGKGYNVVSWGCFGSGGPYNACNTYSSTHYGSCSACCSDHPSVCTTATTSVSDHGPVPHLIYLFSARCLQPPADTINHELIIHKLLVDQYCWNQTSEGDAPFNCHPNIVSPSS